MAEIERNEVSPDDSLQQANYLVEVAEVTYQIDWRWAYIEMYILTPSCSAKIPPDIIRPETVVEGGSLEFVYSIFDYGFKFVSSKADEMYSAGMSMAKLHNTIEKMVYLLTERIKESGGTKETEVQIALHGFIGAQRKSFESIINLDGNVVVVNFDPGEWGEKFLQTVKRLADKGYGFPEEAPRHSYRHALGSTKKSI